MSEAFTVAERAALSPYFSNLDSPVFVLLNMPEVVKGALFARYSRSPKSLRRLFLDEFSEQLPVGASEAAGPPAVTTKGVARAEELYARVFVEYGDDSVAQLGGVHLACEGVSNITTKVLEWGRLMAYLEQSTRYVPYDDQPGGRYRYHVPAELTGDLRARYVRTLDAAFDTYRAWLPRMREHYSALHPKSPGESDAVYRMTIRAKALDTLRGLLPAATTQTIAARLVSATSPEPRDEVTLTDFDPDGEIKVVAAALYAASSLPDDQVLEAVRRMTDEQRRAVLAAYIGRRTNRRHKPGRAFERTAYRFDILGDYGAFRDLQRHRLLTIEWQPLSPQHGYMTPAAIEEAGALADWTRAMRDSAGLHAALGAAGLGDLAPYAVAMAYRVRFYMHMNAREAMHVIELRTAPQGHPAYRRICQQMHRLIAERAGHRAIAEAMTFADHGEVALERLEAERAAERRRR